MEPNLVTLYYNILGDFWKPKTLGAWKDKQKKLTEVNYDW